MTAVGTGLILRFDEELRAHFIQERVDGTGSFSEALSVHDWKIGDLNVALLCFTDSTIDYACLAKKGRRVTTAKVRVDFSEFVDLDALEIGVIEERVSPRLKRYVVSASRGLGSAVPRATWADLVAAVKTERPHSAAGIDRLLDMSRYSRVRLHGPAAEVLAQEREALGISLDIFSGASQLRERVLSSWIPPPDSVTHLDAATATARLTNLPDESVSFLSGIPDEQQFQEESALQHDLFNWPGMTPAHTSGTTTFEQGDRNLSVIYANRNALEHTLGVDLIYYNESYELFVLVQYKLMRKEDGIALYRPDSQLRKELARMDKVYSSTKCTAAIEAHAQYRLNDDGFMFKLVPNHGLRPATGELAAGMYVPREYMHFLLGPNGPKGPLGGTQISFKSAPRYLTNTQFVANVRSGWIGTQSTLTKRLTQVVQQYYETGRAVLVARESRAENQ